MILVICSDALYLSESNACSRVGGHHFLTDIKCTTMNGAMYNIASILKNVMTSAAEAELGDASPMLGMQS